MRILSNSEYLSPTSGIAVQSVQVTEELVRRGHVLDIVYVHDGPFRARYESFANSLRQVPELDANLRDMLRQAPRLASAVRTGARTHPDVVYANRARCLPWAVGVGTVARAPVVCHLHGIVGIETPFVNRWLGRLTSRYICVSRYLRDRFVDLGGDPGRTEVVHNGIDPADYPVGGTDERRRARSALGIEEDAQVVMYFGRIVPEKGVSVLTAALQSLVDRGVDVQLLIMGPQLDGEYGRDSLAACPNVRIHRLETNPDVVTPLHAADVVAVPSVDLEPFGRTVIEALSTGRPVVASAVGGIPEILTGDLSSLLVPSEDSGALASKLEQLIGWRRTRPGLARECTEHVARHFTKDQMTSAIEEILVHSVRRAG